MRGFDIKNGFIFILPTWLFFFLIDWTHATEDRSEPAQIPFVGLTDVLFNQPHLEIDTTSGLFSGIATRLSTPNPIDIWRGIPYAKPPVGDLRFKAPVPLVQHRSIDTESVVRKAWKFGDACPQPASPDIPVPISEDCLSLNIYRPGKSEKALVSPPSEAEKLLPCLVWIHGGGLQYGSSSQYDGSEALPLEDLSVGLKDQIAALQWIQTNIGSFGGDPKKVTIWGQSAGAFSVSLLMTYLSQSQHLFRAAIMDSGSPTSHTVPHVAVYDRPGLPYNLLLRFTGCDQPKNAQANHEDSLTCLRNLPLDVLVNATTAISKYGPYIRQVSVWGPCWKDGSLIDERPSKRLQAGKFLKIPIFIGSNKDEGTLHAATAIMSPISVISETDDYMFEYMSNSSVLDLKVIDPSVYRRVSKLYPPIPELGSPFDTGNATFGLPPIFKRMAAWFGDLHYQAPKRFWATKTSSRQNTYVYYFNGPRNTSAPLHVGVPHSSELDLMIGRGWYQDLPDTEKVMTHRLAKQMRSYVINFVNDLSPSPEWPLYKPSNRRVMMLDKYNSSVVEDDWRSEQMAYLNSQPALDTFYT